MNLCIFMGNLTREPELRVAQNGTQVCRFSLAVNRPRTKNGEDSGVDYFNMVAFNSQAEFISKYFHKGSRALVQGEMRYNRYEDKRTGETKTYYEMNVNHIEFGDTKRAGGERDVSADFAPANSNGQNYNGYSGRTAQNPQPRQNSGYSANTYPQQNNAQTSYEAEGFTPVETITDDTDLPF